MRRDTKALHDYLLRSMLQTNERIMREQYREVSKLAVAEIGCLMFEHAKLKRIIEKNQTTINHDNPRELIGALRATKEIYCSPRSLDISESLSKTFEVKSGRQKGLSLTHQGKQVVLYNDSLNNK